ncbi:hypothetical protein [Bradyrhizobium sp.]|uniref:hypothetical protein n=1 Tax=Bradyrhizobium sp. TaxID=376 RepID=UPI0039E3301E
MFFRDARSPSEMSRERFGPDRWFAERRGQPDRCGGRRMQNGVDAVSDPGAIDGAGILQRRIVTKPRNEIHFDLSFNEIIIRASVE